MIPSIKSYGYSEEEIFFGKIDVKTSDFSNVNNAVSLITERLFGEAVLPLTVKRLDGEDCRYTISATKEGIIVSATESGLFPAFSTISGLIEYGENGSYIKRTEISDCARFNYRGFMLDEARHFQGINTVKKMLDIMFRLKLNVFHWHLSDDQGFRIALPDYSELTDKASKRNYSIVGSYLNKRKQAEDYRGIYQISEIKEIVEYAKARGITVIPEIDLPGHFSAILSAHPEFTCEGRQFEVPGYYGVIENVLCLGNGEAREFAKKLLLNVAKAFDAKIMHIGFDEIKTDKLHGCAKCSERIKELNLKDENALIQAFREEVRDYLIANGISVICWNDGLKDVDDKVICQHWKFNTSKETAERINNGQKTIVSDFFNMYMDYPYSMTPLKKTYAFNPILKNVVKKENVVGIEAPLWTEWVTTENKLKFNAFYRLAAVAETAWNEVKPPYINFMEGLRRKEEYYFGERLDISERLLNPVFPKIKTALYALTSADREVRIWKKRQTSAPTTIQD